jgi:hypothetical protein
LEHELEHGTARSLSQRFLAVISCSCGHWRDKRRAFLDRHQSLGPGPQIIAWSDPDDLLSWYVPRIEGIRVVNLHVRNSGFKIPPFLVWPTGAHDNYVGNKKVLRVILKPTKKE